MIVFHVIPLVQFPPSADAVAYFIRGPVRDDDEKSKSAV